MTYSIPSLTVADPKTWIQILLLTTFLLVLTACGGGGSENTIYEGVDLEQSEDTGAAPAYAGPAAATDDIFRFQNAFFNEYRQTNRCGQCHTQGGQAPQFVRSDDVNLAYSQALSVVDILNPSNSAIVTKMASGHHCWSSSRAICVTEMRRSIESWVNASGSSTTEIELRAPTDREISVSKQLPVSGAQDYSSAVSAFSSTLYPLFSELNCSSCHRSDAGTPQQPYFASDDLNEAYDAARSKIDIDDAVLNRNVGDALSRLVVRLASEFHNCGANCATGADDMLTQIQALESAIPDPVAVPITWVTSKAQVLESNGILSSGGGRIDEGAIARWDFAEGADFIAGDSSGVDPKLQLQLTGNVSWVGGNGVQIGAGGRLQGITATSVKLAQRIKASGAYSVEAWLAPANVTQEGPARIISYSSNNDERNFTLGQTLYNYDFLHRSETTDANGEPALSTADDDELLQATLQHVVITFDPVSGRKIYVNGTDAGVEDSVAGGSLAGWDDNYLLILGNETSGEHQWEGIIRFAAIYDRALTEAEIQTNFDAGVGEKYYLLFNVTELVEIDDDFASYIVFETSVYDSYSYLFGQPFLYRIAQNSVASDAGQDSYSNIPLAGMRIGVNGKEPTVGQAWANMDLSLESGLYGENGQPLSAIGSILALEAGSNADEFFLTFERIGNFSDVRVAATVSPTAPTIGEQEPTIGLRNFAEVNATMSVITGVPITNSEVVNTYNTVRQQLPTSTAIEGFLSAHQMAVAQMAIEYCSELVNDVTLRDTFFPEFGVNFDLDIASAFDTEAKRNQIVLPLYYRVLGFNLASQPDQAAVTTELNNLIQNLMNNHLTDSNSNNDGAADTRNIVKATCAATLGSAAMLIQ